MKFYMYAPSLFQNISKTAERVLLSVFFIVLVGFVVLCGYCLFFQLFIELFLAVASAALCLGYAFCIVSIPKCYIEIEGENIKVVTYIFSVKREKNIQFSQIHRAYIGVAKSCRNSWLPLKRCPHEIEFEDYEGKKLFTVYHTEESYEVFKDYIVNYDIYLKNIEG